MTPYLIATNILNLLKKTANSKFLLITFLSLFTSSALAATSFIAVADGGSVVYIAPDNDDDAFDGESDGVGTLIIESGTTASPHSVGNDHPLLALNIESGATLNLVTDGSNGGKISATNTTNAGTINFNDDARTITGNLSGTGTGTFNIGDQDHTISGSFTTLTGDSVSLIVTDSVSAATITSTGESNLASGTKLNLTLESTDIAGSSYTIFTGGSGSQINISEADLNVNNSGANRSGDLAFRSSISGNNFVLTAIEKSKTLSSISGESEAYDAIHYYIDATGTLETIQSYLDSSSVSDYDKSKAINSITPQADNSNNRIVFNFNNSALNLTSDRLGSLRKNHSDIPSKNQNISKNIWMQQFGSSITQGRVSGSEGYRSKSLGIIMGSDRKISKDFTLGVSGSYSKSGTKSKNSLQETVIDLYQASLYSGYNIDDKYFINTMLGLSWNDYSSSRVMPVASSVAHSNYSGQSYFGRIEAGTDHKFNNALTITPKLILTAAHSRTDNYTEDGAGTLNLNVRTKSSNFFETRFGTVFAYKILTEFGNFVPKIALSYGYDFAASKQRTNSRFINQSTSFQSNAPKVAQGSWNFATGLNIYKTNSVILSADYNYDYRKEYHGHIGLLKVKYNF